MHHGQINPAFSFSKNILISTYGLLIYCGFTLCSQYMVWVKHRMIISGDWKENSSWIQLAFQWRKNSSLPPLTPFTHKLDWTRRGWQRQAVTFNMPRSSQVTHVKEVTYSHMCHGYKWTNFHEDYGCKQLLITILCHLHLVPTCTHFI